MSPATLPVDGTQATQVTPKSTSASFPRSSPSALQRRMVPSSLQLINSLNGVHVTAVTVSVSASPTRARQPT